MVLTFAQKNGFQFTVTVSILGFAGLDDLKKPIPIDTFRYLF